jgi:hypothetical protein
MEIANYENTWEAPCDPRDEWLKERFPKQNGFGNGDVQKFFGRKHLSPNTILKIQDQSRAAAPYPSLVLAVKLPGAIFLFYALGLACTLTFAFLLALSASGHNVIHPFLSVLGLIGGLGWLSTAWVDLVLWKHHNLRGYKFTQEERSISANNTR